jgi:sortase A
MRRALRGLSTVLIVAGTLLIADAGLTLAWQEPLSALYARLTQNQLSGDLNKLETAPPTALERRALARLPGEARRLRFLARALRHRVDDGGALGRIAIPRIGAKYVFVAGTDPAALRKGPGHYPATPLPGEPGTVAIAGHRTTYLAPFRHIDRLRRGDQITLRMPYGRFTYAVQQTRIVPPTEVSVTRRVGYDRLVLSACHPLYSAAKRIVVFARLERTEPLGAALAH